MHIQLRFFASVRERLGASQESLIVPPGVLSVADMLAHLRARGGVWAEVLAEGSALRMAYDQEIVDGAALLADGGELAIFPPVTGG